MPLRELASKELSVEISGNQRYTQKKDYLNVFYVRETVAYFPYHYAREKLKLPTKLRSDYPRANIVYKTEEYPLREEQVLVKTKAIAALNKEGSCVLALYTGFGKTCLSIYLAAKLKLKVLYINNRLSIIDQLLEEVERFSHSKVQLLTPKTSVDPSADFYVVNAINVPKFKFGTFKNIGTLIVDEVHCMLAQAMSQALHHITPRYLIGLSATPYRADGLDLLFDLYFGPERIYIPLYRKHTVYKLDSPLVPTIEYTAGGTLNWGTILKDQAESGERNKKIVDILQKFSDRVFMVICKRLHQVDALYDLLKSAGESVDKLTGKKKTYDPEARILIGTGQKMGVGFNQPRVNALVLAADFEAYFIQTLGRSMRTPEVEPLIFDIVDQNSSLKKHWKTREKVYREHGGEIKGLDWGTLEEAEIKEETRGRKKQEPRAILF